MACISLLIRREVIEEIGFFDSLRVGADTEYIERIEANYGKIDDYAFRFHPCS